MSHDDERRERIRRQYQQENEAQRLFIPAREKISINATDKPMRVCAYCRVSTDNDEQLSSFELYGMKHNWSKRVEAFVNHRARRMEVMRFEKNDLLALCQYTRKEYVPLGQGRNTD